MTLLCSLKDISSRLAPSATPLTNSGVQDDDCDEVDDDDEAWELWDHVLDEISCIIS